MIALAFAGRLSRARHSDRLGHAAQLADPRALVYPAMYGIGRLYIRLAEQGERDFIHRRRRDGTQ